MAADPRAALALAWQAGAMRRGAMALVLWPLSILYRVLLGLRRAAYRWGQLRTERLHVPVIVVGNVVVGGAGKTPTTIALVQALRQRGWTPGVISRGHGRQATPLPLQVRAQSSAKEVGDEPLLIHQATGAPVVVALRRVEAGRALLQANPSVDVILSDDGLQHWALSRDVDVVVMDDRGIGNGWLLPAGLLREPWPPAPNNRPSVILCQQTQTKGATSCPMPDGVPVFQATRALSPLAINALGQTHAWAEWADTPVSAVAGVARPEVFFDMLRQGGLSRLATHALVDHAAASDYASIWAQTQGNLLCTDKDAVKLFALPGVDPARAWRVPLLLNSSADWIEAVIARLPSRL